MFGKNEVEMKLLLISDGGPSSHSLGLIFLSAFYFTLFALFFKTLIHLMTKGSSHKTIVILQGWKKLKMFRNHKKGRPSHTAAQPGLPLHGGWWTGLLLLFHCRRDRVGRL
jgi:hypothetical protein